MRLTMIATLAGLATAGLAALLPGAAAAAEPWEFMTLDEDTSPLYMAAQLDPVTGLVLVVDCFYDLNEYSIAIAHEEDYDETASYPTSVRAQWVVDGEIVNAPDLAYEDRGELALSAYQYDADSRFDTLYEAIRGARESVTVSYSDTVAVFDATGVAEAVAAVEEACGGGM